MPSNTGRLGVTAVVAAALLVIVGFGLRPARVQAVGTQGDPLQGKQWGLAKIGAPSAWAASTGAGVTIGVVDTGVDLTHEDLAGKVTATANCVGSSGDASKCQSGGARTTTATDRT